MNTSGEQLAKIQAKNKLVTKNCGEQEDVTIRDTFVRCFNDECDRKEP